MPNETSPSGFHQRHCVVVDTSIWRSEPLLLTPLGVTLVYTVNRLGGVIGLPEVIELELKTQIVEAGLKAREKVEVHCGLLHTLTNAPLKMLLPTREVIEKRVLERLAAINPILVRQPFTFEHARAALRMVLDKLPPNGPENQQFKDSVIWQAVLSLARTYSIHFITNDRAFFHEKDATKGLANNLKHDVQTAGANVQLYCDIGSCLKILGGAEPEFDREFVSKLILSAIRPSLEAQAAYAKFEVREVQDVKLKAFSTEMLNRVAIDYTATYKLEDVASTDQRTRRRDGCGIVYGSSYFDRVGRSLDSQYVQEIDILCGGSSYRQSFKDYDKWALIPRPFYLENNG